MSIQFFNQWKSIFIKKDKDFSLIIFEYKKQYDGIDDTIQEYIICGLLGFGFVFCVSY